MYVGFAAGWIGLWIILGHSNPGVIAAVTAVALGIHLFVVFYEEPTLRGKFGDDYLEYCRNVRRWGPRIRAWRQDWELGNGGTTQERRGLKSFVGARDWPRKPNRRQGRKRFWTRLPSPWRRSGCR